MTERRVRGAELLVQSTQAREAGNGLRLWGQSLEGQSPDQLLACRSPSGKELSTEALRWMSGGVAHLLAQKLQAPWVADLGDAWLLSDQGTHSFEQFLTVTREAQSSARSQAPRDLVVFGMGRIGRVILRLLAEQGATPYLRLRALAVRGGKDGMERRNELLLRDSVHGRMLGGASLLDAGARLRFGADTSAVWQQEDVAVVDAPTPDGTDYSPAADGQGIEDALVIDTTGVWRDADGLGGHLQAKGVSGVILTVPGKGMPDVVWGVNHREQDPRSPLLTAASCTTNAVAPVLHLIEQEYGIGQGHLETVHAYTNDQSLVDNQHEKPRRGRSAVQNMVITSTGAAQAVVDIVPTLAGKLTGNAVRVPVADVSLAILSLRLERSGKDIRDYLRQCVSSQQWRQVIAIEDSEEAASSDFIGSRHAGVLDMSACIVNAKDPHQVVLYVWYDNEMGYAAQVLRLAEYCSGVEPVLLPSSR